MKIRYFLPAAFAALAVGLAGCNASSSGGSSSGGSSSEFTGVNGPLDPVQNGVADVIGGQLGDALPEPLGPGVKCLEDSVNFLVDGPDALLAALLALPEGADPQAAFEEAAADVQLSLEAFAAQLLAALVTLSGDNPECDTNGAGGGGDGENPLAGTPLEPVGAVLVELQGALGLLGDDEGDGGNGGQDPNMTPLLAETIAPLLVQLSAAFDQVPEEARQAPVLGGLFLTLQQGSADLADVLQNAGPYDGPGTSASLEVFLNNLLGNVLLQVIPVAELDAQTGQDFSSQIQDGIDTLTAALVGDGLSQLINPLFDDVADDAAEPLLQPLEDALAMILAGDAGGGGTGTPLDQLIGLLTGEGGGGLLDEILDPILGALSGGLPL